MMAPPVEQEPSIWGLVSGLVSQVPSLGDALGMVGKKTKGFFSPEHFISSIPTDKVVKTVVRNFLAVLAGPNID